MQLSLFWYFALLLFYLDHETSETFHCGIHSFPCVLRHTDACFIDF